MAGKRLESWSTLNREDLKQRIDEEIRRTHLSFAEQQLLEAAQERLRTWREPRQRGSSSMNDDPKPTDPPEPKEEDKADNPSKEKKKMAARKTSKVRTGAKRTAGKTTTKTRQGVTRSRIDPDAKVVKTGKPNPFREGSGPWERTELVLKNSGKTAGTIANLKGVKSSTLGTLKKRGIVKIG
jgi:hypothetical protein